MTGSPEVEQVRLIVETVDGRQHVYEYPRSVAESMIDRWRDASNGDGTVPVRGGAIASRHIVRMVRGALKSPPPPNPYAGPKPTLKDVIGKTSILDKHPSGLDWLRSLFRR
ncbi:hypothetical protein [Deinococcus frigens]|uniref:hypothetical protein n=1 Tax=Deinococcus frigens TaxID=249403 RepID=UPI00049518C4|nr:hypothetical protein [Deinococcus frigens]